MKSLKRFFVPLSIDYFALILGKNATDLFVWQEFKALFRLKLKHAISKMFSLILLPLLLSLSILSVL